MSVQSLLAEHELTPRKKWGQHFLTDPRILESIADAGEVSADDTVLEIGPGLGHLTRVLVRRAGRVIAVEVDGDLAQRLRDEFSSHANFRLICGDILDFQTHQLLSEGIESPSTSIPFKIVANLPYYITSAILRHVLEAEHKPTRVVVMVQREVAQRMIARPPHMNLLAVSVQFFARVRVVRTIAAGAFYPRPKVDSAVVRLDVRETFPVAASETARFFEIVRAGFGERRKQLRNALAHGLQLDAGEVEQWLHRAQIDAHRRAETLTLDEWARVFQAGGLGHRL